MVHVAGMCFKLHHDAEPVMQSPCANWLVLASVSCSFVAYLMALQCQAAASVFWLGACAAVLGFVFIHKALAGRCHGHTSRHLWLSALHVFGCHWVMFFIVAC